MKYVIIVPDGAADNPIKKLGDKTPLQVARMPHMDALVKRGVVGSMQNTPKGFKAGSDVCNLSLVIWCFIEG